MDLKSCTSCFMLFLSFVYLDYAEKFRSHPNNITTTEHTENVRSKLECAAKCTAKNKCHSFLFDKKTKTCIMSRGFAEYTANTRYNAAKCEHNIGYTYLSWLNLCYRIEKQTVHRLPKIKQICESEGAHLVVIENQEIDQFLRDLILASDGQTDSPQRIPKSKYSSSIQMGLRMWQDSLNISDRFYIDGNDEASHGQWRTFSGEPMAYFNWAGFDPAEESKQQNCLALLKVTDFRWGDTYCDDPRPVGGFICQLDV